MRFMVFMLPQSYRGNKAADMKDMKIEAFEKMGKFNDDMVKAGIVMSAADGLQPLTKGARISFAGGKATVIDGPFVETKEVFGGYWMLEAKSKEELVNWMKRCPAEDGDILEIRQIFEMSDFPKEVQALFAGEKK